MAIRAPMPGRGYAGAGSMREFGQLGLSANAVFAFTLYVDAFNAQLARMRREFGLQNAGSPILVTAFVLLTKIIEKTPVWTGECRANWYYSMDRLSSLMGGATPRAPAPRTEAEKFGYSSARFNYARNGTTGHTVTMTNRAKHAMKLEYGWSMKAPWGMVRISIQEMYGVLPSLVKKQLSYMWANGGVAPGTGFWGGAHYGPKLGKYQYEAPEIGRAAKPPRWSRKRI